MGNKFCANCGSALTPGAAFCDNCGTPVPGSPPAHQPQAYAPPQQPPAYQPPPVSPPPQQPPAYQPPQAPYQPPAYQQPVYQPVSGPPFQQSAASGQVSPKSKAVLALLTFFLGGIGAHKFYVGKIGTGIFIIIWLIIGYIAAFAGAVAGALLEETGVLPYGMSSAGSLLGNLVLFPLGIWIFVDFIRALMGKIKDKEGRAIAK